MKKVKDSWSREDSDEETPNLSVAVDGYQEANLGISDGYEVIVFVQQSKNKF